MSRPSTYLLSTQQTAEREAARMGFGGSAPCAQRNGHQKFVTKHPKQYLMDAINNGASAPKKAIFGANKHEGSFVLGSMAIFIIDIADLICIPTFSDLQLLHST